VFAGVPLLWYTDVALALRPKEGHDYRQLLAHRASDDPRAFQDEHLTVAWARRSRVLVISPHQELHRQAIRILAVHGYEEERGLSRARSRLERGEVPGLVHVREREDLGWEAAVISLSQVLEVPRAVLEDGYVVGVREVCSLSDKGLSVVLARLRAYLALVDRRPQGRRAVSLHARSGQSATEGHPHRRCRSRG